MSDDSLTADELLALLGRVFAPTDEDRSVAILVDLPDEALADNPDWRARRQIAAGWATALDGADPAQWPEVSLICYRNVRTNNADLPATAAVIDPEAAPETADCLPAGTEQPFEDLLAAASVVLAPTELSTTAPLKVLAPRLGFRAATMPGFSPAMIPALRLDYVEVNRRVWWLKELLDRSQACDIRFTVDGSRKLDLHLDLRHRTAHASGGLLPARGTAGNLPSGEAYIVPYEGELEGDLTGTSGVLPIQLGDEVVEFRIRDNRAVGVLSRGPESDRARHHLASEPAAGNVAELGLGVLADFGVDPIGEVLLDEKLGLHIAFGRSEHFGGQVGPAQFSAPEAVIHQDHVYLPELQPRVVPELVTLELEDGSALDLMRDGGYVVDFGERATRDG
jgi:hypothetical protein